MLTRVTRRGQDEGSLVLALLLVLMVTALLPVVAVAVTAEQKLTRRDRDSGIALEVADAGIQDARYRLINRMVQPADATTAPQGYVTATGSVNDVPFTWRAKPIGSAEEVASGLYWRVVSVGGGDGGGPRRMVRATLEQQRLFSHALFINSNADLGGFNTVDSYDSVSDAKFTGKGFVGSNGSLVIPGNNTADRVTMYDWAANPDPGRCIAQGNSGPLCQLAPATGTTATAKRLNVLPRFAMPAQAQEVDTVLASCSASDRTRIWKASDHRVGATATFNLGSGVLCFGSLIFDVDTVFPPSAMPYKLYVAGTVSVGNGVHVNCQGCGNGLDNTPAAALPDSTRLQLFSPATGLAFTMRPNAKIAAGLFFPRASCGSPNSSAQANVFGALMCDSLTNVGGWKFHYDEAIARAAGTGEFTVSSWDETPGSEAP